MALFASLSIIANYHLPLSGALAGRNMDTSAKYHEMGLLLGILKPTDVQLWVDDQISKADEPSEILIELAFAGNSVNELISLLSQLKTNTDDYTIIKQLLADIKDEDILDIEFCRRLADSLYNLYVQNDYEAPDDLTEIAFFDDGYELAEKGLYGTIDSWHSEFKSFVKAFKAS